jgi:outer membrane protein W
MIRLKTLKLAFAAAILCCLSENAAAQKVYLKIGGGYNFGIGGLSGYKINRVVHDEDPNLVSQVSERAERIKINYGKGLNGSAAVGYMFNERFGAELEAGYLAGGNNESSSHLIFSSQPDKPIIHNYKSHARMLLLQPWFVFTSKMDGPLDLYGKFGIVAGRGAIFINGHIVNQTPDIQERTTEEKYYGGWGFGLAAALGLNYKVNEKFGLFSEIKMSNLSYSPSVYRLEKETLNGQDITSYRQQTVDLINSYSTTYTNDPTVYLKEAFSFSSVGINIGLKYNL